jgi:hypothetical protein
MNYDNLKETNQIEYIITKYKDKPGIGLYSGRAGVSLLYFLLAEVNNSDDYKQSGIYHYNYIYANIFNIDNLSFKDGLSGVGWFIDFSSQNLFIKNNPQELLNEIDDIIYKLITFHKDLSFSFNTENINNLLYLYQRILSKQNNSFPYRKLALNECFIYLINKIYIQIKTIQFDNYNLDELIKCYLIINNFKLLNIQCLLTEEILLKLKKIIIKMKKEKKRKIIIENYSTDLSEAINSLICVNKKNYYLKRIIY